MNSESSIEYTFWANPIGCTQSVHSLLFSSNVKEVNKSPGISPGRMLFTWLGKFCFSISSPYMAWLNFSSARKVPYRLFYFFFFVHFSFYLCELLVTSSKLNTILWFVRKFGEIFPKSTLYAQKTSVSAISESSKWPSFRAFSKHGFPVMQRVSCDASLPRTTSTAAHPN